MKQFIVMLAVLPLMLVFLLQFSLEQQNSVKIAAVSDIVYAAKEEAKQAGAFTAEIQAGMKRRISERLGIPESEIIIESEVSEVYRVDSERGRGIISYRVSVPIGSIVAGRSLFGIREEDNRYVYTIRSITASEKLSP